MRTVRLLDLGNGLNLFDTISWWDDGMRFLNWLLLISGVLLAWSGRGVSRSVVVMCGLAFGIAAALMWELGEYASFIRGSPELQTAYTDTLGDLTLGTLGQNWSPVRQAISCRVRLLPSGSLNPA